MFLAAVYVILLTSPQPSCADAVSCRQAAIEAQARKDYETFHDLAWLAYRKGRQDDPELMLLLARAQSLSGRPGDAIVMLERLAARGIATDAATSEDFEAVRALPRWNASAAGAKDAAASKDPAYVPKDPAAVPKAAPDRAGSKDPASVPRDPAVPKAPKGARSASAGGLSFTTLLSPTALAYDAVSKRYLIADRQARRVAIIDENTGQVSTLAGAQARLGEINGIAIDARQGDLWVVSSADEGFSVSRLQLISGRELGAVRITGLRSNVVGVAFARGTGLVVADDQGDIWRVSPSGKTEKLGSLEYIPKAIAADPEGTLYVTAGGPRLARFSAAPFRRLGIVDLGADGLAGLPFAVTSDRIHLVVPQAGAYEIRTVKK